MKLSTRKDANKIRLLKKGLKGINLSSLCINSAVYLNDSFLHTLFQFGLTIAPIQNTGLINAKYNNDK